jgi:hypothetical protein
VYVHCVQGISRSATICIAYKIFTERCTYNEAYEELKSKRDCINPNMTFIAQLVWFQKRLFESNFDCLPVNPRVFLVCSHAPEDPNRVVAKLLMENLYLQGGRGSARNGKVLDPRAMFIV